MHAAARLALFGFALTAAAASTWAQDAPQNYIELRAAGCTDGLYCYAEVSHVFRNRAVVDLVYIGVPGQNELYGGVGYQVRATPTLAVTPLVYGAVGKDNGQRGVAVGAFVGGMVRRWSAYAFGAYFEPMEGRVARYVFLDSLDVSRKVRNWELGASTGLFYTQNKWTSLIGPVLVRNDAWGAWRFCVRGGSTAEFRLTRTFGFYPGAWLAVSDLPVIPRQRRERAGQGPAGRLVKSVSRVGIAPAIILDGRRQGLGVHQSPNLGHYAVSCRSGRPCRGPLAASVSRWSVDLRHPFPGRPPSGTSGAFGGQRRVDGGEFLRTAACYK